VRRCWRWLLLAVSIAAVGLSAAAGWFAHDMPRVLNRALPVTAARLFEVEPGETIGRISSRFVAEGWLPYAIYLRLDATRRGVAGRVQAGTYEVSPGASARSLLDKFVRGEVKQYRYTFVEGLRFRELRALLTDLPGVSSTISQMDEAEIMTAIGAPDQSPEGWFFPSTYFYHHHTRDLDLLARAHAKMRAELLAAWKSRAPDLPYANPGEALIMASIVEKETGRAAERAAIAGVFVRRLQQGMKLQTDPTVIYGLGDEFDGNLRREDLLRDTPFNTYTRAGLPPTPIAMPGRAAIDAALHPAPGSALYFVARGDGSHEFSATLEDHNAAVRRYQVR
jgi:UPF0755 protein